MDISPHIPSGRMVITGYGPGMFRINDHAYQGPVLVFPDRVLSWSVGAFSALGATDFAALSAAAEPVEVLLIGSGDTMLFMPPAMRQAVRALGPVPDVMDTGAACRTYNVLLGEGRRVAAALLPTSGGGSAPE